MAGNTLLDRITGWLDQHDQDTCAKMMRRIDRRCWMVANTKRAYSLMLAATGGVVVAAIAGIAAAWTFGGNGWFDVPIVLCMMVAGGAEVYLRLRLRYRREAM